MVKFNENASLNTGQVSDRRGSGGGGGYERSGGGGYERSGRGGGGGSYDRYDGGGDGGGRAERVEGYDRKSHDYNGHDDR